MFDPVLLARPRGEMTHADRKSQLIRQALQLHSPQPHSAAIATPAIRGDQQLAGVSIDRLTHLSICRHHLRERLEQFVTEKAVRGPGRPPI